MQCQHDEDDLQIWDPSGWFHRTIWDLGGSWTGVVGFLLWLQVM
ncbi:unnamed protein product, partial [Adineta steineri]